MNCLTLPKSPSLQTVQKSICCPLLSTCEGVTYRSKTQWTTCYMSSTTCTSLPQLEKVHTIAGTTQRSRAQAHLPTTPCAVDTLLQYSTRALTSCVLHREQWRTGTATIGGGMNELCPTMLLLMVAGGRVRARMMLAEASVEGGLVDGCSFWWWERHAKLIQRFDGGRAIGQWSCVAKRCC